MKSSSAETTCFDLPSAQGPAILSMLVELDPLASTEPEERRYPERVERFCQNVILRRLTGQISPEYLGEAIQRMFSPAEVVDSLSRDILERLKFQICRLLIKE